MCILLHTKCSRMFSRCYKVRPLKNGQADAKGNLVKIWVDSGDITMIYRFCCVYKPTFEPEPTMYSLKSFDHACRNEMLCMKPSDEECQP